MRTKYSDLDIHFEFEGFRIDAPNIIFEHFTRTIPAHSHGSGCYEIHYIPGGYGKLEADNAFYDIAPGTLYVTGPHVRHAQTPILRDPMQEYCVYLKVHTTAKKKTPSPLMDVFLSTNFWYGNDSRELNSPEINSPEMSSSEMSPPEMSSSEMSPPEMSSPEMSSFGIHFLMKQLFAELERKNTGYLTQAKLLLSQLIVCLVRNYERGARRTELSPARNLQDGESVIIEEYFLYEYDHLSLAGLAHRLGLSQRQTQRLLLEYYGNTFQQKKTEARMSAAAIFLGDKSRSVTSVAETLGYSSPEHFAAEFKKYYGVSPRAFRSRL